jgi:hypothetical protein
VATNARNALFKFSAGRAGTLAVNDPQLTEQLDQIETQLVKVMLANQIENNDPETAFKRWGLCL